MTHSRADFCAAVLISGGGSNLQAFIDAIDEDQLGIELVVVISNKADVFGLTRATRAGIDALTVQNTDFAERAEFEVALADAIDRYEPDVIILAGFMRILSAPFVNRYRGRIINIHPSLLPKYPGLNTHRRALDSGDRWHGCTVHFVTEELDGGPPIIQGRVRVTDGDTEEQLAERVLGLEHTIYPRAVDLIAKGRLLLRDGEVWLDGDRLLEPIQITS